MAVLLLRDHSSATCTTKDDISARAIFVIFGYLSFDWGLSKPSQASSFHFGGFPIALIFNFCHVHNQRLGGSYLNVSISMPFYFLLFRST